MSNTTENKLGVYISPGHEEAASEGTLPYQNYPEYQGHQGAICDICHGSVEANPLYVMPCRHAFHHSCIYQCFQSQNGQRICPACRTQDDNELENNIKQYPILFHLLYHNLPPDVVIKNSSSFGYQLKLSYAWVVTDVSLDITILTYAPEARRQFSNQYGSFSMRVIKDTGYMLPVAIEYQCDCELHIENLLEILFHIKECMEKLENSQPDYQQYFTIIEMRNLMQWVDLYRFYRVKDITDEQAVEREQNYSEEHYFLSF